ncbi:L-dopachrome tautomerase-related protein [Chishuiella changwenlii]|uniref:L-dopachrome tautomerase-related protein n=1 Tax=Chishuiella changwenlii TaxID=1434701 RepID=UPI002FDB047D
MKKRYPKLVLLTSLIACLILLSCNSDDVKNSRENDLVASVKGVQITTIAITQTGRIFVNAPRWRTGNAFAVAEIVNGEPIPYPNQQMNSWDIGNPISEEKFTAVQAVFAKENLLYVVDTGNAMFRGVITPPKIYVFDTSSNSIIKTYTLPDTVYTNNSYINDLRVDNKNNRIYITDSNVPGLIIINTLTEEYTRVLHEHPWTTAEVNFLTIDGNRWERTVHSDGIALNKNSDTLFIHTLTGYTLYGIPTKALIDPTLLPQTKPLKVQTAAVDGMIMDDNGNIYYGDLENRLIQYLKPDRKTIRTLASDRRKISWPDGFAIYNNYLYYVNSRIQEVGVGEDTSGFDFTIYKVPLPK